jgi:TorA maturation chaperone TorD
MSEIDTAHASATAAEDLCRFLSACYYEPTQMFAEEHLFESMAAAAQKLHPDLAALAQGLGAAFAAQDLQTLLVDYTRLFLGPVNPLASPYGSVWLTGEKTLMQDTTQSVLGLYAQGGFDIDEAFQELPDHVAVELEFLYLLNFRIREATAAGAGAEAAAERPRLSALREQFLDQHLGAWVGPFTQAVQAGAECAFYRDVAALTALFVQLQRQAQP